MRLASSLGIVGTLLSLTPSPLVGDSWIVLGDSPIPLVVTSNRPDVSPSVDQLVTFTFAEPVVGFVKSDIQVSGAIAGDFTPVSSTVYTLSLVGIGGRVKITVPRGAAEAPGSGLISAEGELANFYQDTWTIDLPGPVPMELIRIPAGSFTMGSPGNEQSRQGDEVPHPVTLTEDFYLGKTEVTQNQWTAFQAFPDAQTVVGGTIPVHNVNWTDIGSWTATLNAQVTEPGTFGLPTEAQWEYACRAGTTTRFSFGNGLGTNDGCEVTAELTDNLWYCGNNSPDGAKPVGQKPVNPWGLYDMHGNLWEICADFYGDYDLQIANDPVGPASGFHRVTRGGAFTYGSVNARSANRDWVREDERYPNIGFRVAADRRVPMTITSSVPGPIHQSAFQALTFTFDTPVSGFDASDVTVTGAIKGAFGAASESVYWLHMTCTGGTVTASVPANAAVPPPPYTGTAAASVSNFYQDTLTIILPGSVPMELIRIPVGSFAMGSLDLELSRSEDEDQHLVTLTKEFYIGKREVTQDQWAALQSFPVAQIYEGGTLPVQSVSWDDTVSWMTALDAHVAEPYDFTLPTEAQWEYACRAQTATRFNFGDGFGANENCSAEPERTGSMWYCGNSQNAGPGPVGQKLENPWGLFDMHGNQLEWCSDWYDTYDLVNTIDPTGPASPFPGRGRVARGGSWISIVANSRSASRDDYSPDFRGGTLGFRVVAAPRTVPLTITSSVPAPVHQAATQTLTFTFDVSVSGFDASDVTVTGATKGDFGSNSASEYWLDLTGTGGTISASVSANAAVPPRPYGGTAAASVTNFYQDTWTINLPGSVPMELIRIPAGSFAMGSPESEASRGSDEVQHSVTLTKDYYMGKTEVTQDQWSALQSFPVAQTYQGGTLPVHNVSWNDVSSWMTALNIHVTEQGTFSLPTEAEWEHSCRAGTTTRFNFGGGFTIDDNCAPEAEAMLYLWFCGNNSPNGTKAVGQKPASAWGLLDTHGNVAEWCADLYGAYDTVNTVDPTGAASGANRVFRGGGWSSGIRFCRSAQRGSAIPSVQLDNLGFRVRAIW